MLLLHDTKKVTTKALPIILDWIDDENRRRIEAGRRPIRILSFVDIAREQLAPGFEDWLRDTSDDVTAFADVVGTLIPAAAAPTLGRR